jgi:hypothetical protein
VNAPNEAIRQFLHRVLPLYDNTFNNVLPITACEIVPNSNDFVIKFPLPANYSFSLNKLKTGSLTLSQNNDITLTGLMFKYHYNDYTIEPSVSNRFFLHIHKNSIDYEIDKGMIVYLSLPNVINQDYYSVYSVTRTSTKTTITILMEDGYFALKNELKNNPTNLIDVYTDYGNTVSGYNGMKKVKSITESGGVVSVTVAKDEHFNFTVDAIDFYCGFAKMHFNFNIKCVIPEEYRKFGMPDDAKAERNALLVSITRSRPGDEGVEFSSSRTLSRILTLNLHLFFYRPLFLDKSAGDRVDSATILDGIQDKAHIVSEGIMKVLTIYENYIGTQTGLSVQGATKRINPQQFNLITDGTDKSNMCEYRAALDVHKDLFSIDKGLLNKESMLKGLQYQVNLQLYGN